MSYKYDSHYLQVNWCYMYCRLLIIQIFKVRVIGSSSYRGKNYIEYNLKGNENCFELGGGSCYRGFELPGVDCINKHLFKCSDLNWQ